MADLGKYLIMLGIVIAVVGALLVLAPRLPWLGRLPGDILIRKKNVTIFFPVVSCLVVSLLLTLLLSLFRR